MVPLQQPHTQRPNLSSNVLPKGNIRICRDLTFFKDTIYIGTAGILAALDPEVPLPTKEKEIDVQMKTRWSTKLNPTVFSSQRNVTFALHHELPIIFVSYVRLL